MIIMGKVISKELLALALTIKFFFFASNGECFNCISRRAAFGMGASTILWHPFVPKQQLAWCADLVPVNNSERIDLTSVSEYQYENRDRNNNKDAIIREDYWYLTGRLPPRRLEVELNIDDPQFNAFGSCETRSSGESSTNSCTYVSLKQRIPAYSKYGYAISDGAKEYKKLGNLLELTVSTPSDVDNIWNEAASFVTTYDRTIPPAIIDAELKMVLFATAMLTSSSFPTPGRELLVARFYANEAHFAAKEMSLAIQNRDSNRAIDAWKFGKDSWNSYFRVVNKAITPKVGEQFQKIV